MPRVARLWDPCGIYHIDARAHRGEPIFAADEDREFVLVRAARAFAEEGMTCYGIAVLNNHFHTVVRCPGPPGRAILKLNTAIARRTRAGSVGDGAVFQGRFFSGLCMDEASLFARLAYVIANPVHHRVVPTIDSLQHHPWSSLGEVLGSCKARVTDVAATLALFDVDADRARQQLLTLLDARARVRAERNDTPDVDPDLEGRRPPTLALPRRLVDEIGAHRTLGSISGPLPTEAEDWDTPRARRAVLKANGWTVSNLLAAACDLCGADERAVREWRRTRAESRARRLVAYVACDRLALPLREVARVVGASDAAVSLARSSGRSALEASGVTADELIARSRGQGVA